MSRCYIQLGKAGDILSVLPILQHEFEQTRDRPYLMVSTEYAPLLEGVSYVQRIIYQHPFSDLKGAIKAAKCGFPDVVVTQVYGEGFPVMRQTPSFQLDQWLRAGCMEKFGDWPLIFDRRDQGREKQLLAKHVNGKPFILLADYSESSPFPQKEELAKLLKDAFSQTHDIIRLSEIRAERFYDLLGLYDHAVALVTIETAHLHLSAASKVPTFVLATDQPSLWHGSFFQKRFAYYMRYGQWESNRTELMGEIHKTIWNDSLDSVTVEPFPEAKYWGIAGHTPPLSKQAQISTMDYHLGAYNPSIIEFEGRRLAAFRFHNPESRQRLNSSLAIADESTNEVKEVEPNVKGITDALSMEDPRFFIFRGKLHLSFVLSKIGSGITNCICAYGELQQEKSWHLANHFVPQTGRNTFGYMEKNFVFFEAEEKLHMIYTSNPHTVFELDGERVVKRHVGKPIAWGWGQIRGGAIVPYFKDQLLRFFHSRDRNNRYYIGAMIMEDHPPFAVLQVSKEPILYGSPWEKENVFHWKPNVVFPGGAVKHGDGWIVSIGVNDSRCCLVKLGENDLNL